MNIEFVVCLVIICVVICIKNARLPQKCSSTEGFIKEDAARYDFDGKCYDTCLKSKDSTGKQDVTGRYCVKACGMDFLNAGMDVAGGKITETSLEDFNTAFARNPSCMSAGWKFASNMQSLDFAGVPRPR